VTGASDPRYLAQRLSDLDDEAAANASDIRVVHAPGRVNLIGEHTDYNDGFVLPAAIDLGISIAMVPTDDRRVELRLLDGGERAVLELDTIGDRRGHWLDYVAGTAWAMAEAGLPTRGFRGLLASDLPAGAGLSSSAALELAAAWALSGGEGPAADRMRMAQIARRAENGYVGVQSGLMDQFAVAFGRADHALLLDCRSLEHRAVPLPAGTRLVICHTSVPRNLAASAFNTRRAECERAVAALASRVPGIRALRDADLTALDAVRGDLDDAAFRRARHVITEDARVVAMVDALAAGDLDAVAAAMTASHASLRDDYEVSSDALDALVAIAVSVPGVIGARLTGAGFGGCTVNLVHDDAVAGLREAVETRYPGMTGLTPTVLEVDAADGVRRVA
jgi:galactokinase